MNGGAFLFPGQGTSLRLPSERIRGAGPIRDMLQMASDIMHVDLSELLVSGRPEATRTEIVQPATVAVTLGLAMEKEQEESPVQAVAGHSLGELTAATFAGCLSREAALQAAVVRGKVMGDAARRSPGGMGAIRCPDEAKVRALLEEGRKYGALDVAAHNAPFQWVLSGDRAALGAVAARTPLTLLPVTGPWHSQAMRDAAKLWQEELDKCSWQPPRHLFVLTATANPAPPVAEFPAALASLLYRPVMWTATIETIRRAGITRFVFLETDRVLRNLVREIVVDDDQVEAK